MAVSCRGKSCSFHFRLVAVLSAGSGEIETSTAL
jgi:hypothetical protein